MKIKKMEIKLKAELVLDLKENALRPKLFFRIKGKGDRKTLLEDVFQLKGKVLTEEFNCCAVIDEDGLLIFRIQPKSE